MVAVAVVPNRHDAYTSGQPDACSSTAALTTASSQLAGLAQWPASEFAPISSRFAASGPRRLCRRPGPRPGRHCRVCMVGVDGWRRAGHSGWRRTLVGEVGVLLFQVLGLGGGSRCAACFGHVGLLHQVAGVGGMHAWRRRHGQPLASVAVHWALHRVPCLYGTAPCRAIVTPAAPAARRGRPCPARPSAWAPARAARGRHLNPLVFTEWMTGTCPFCPYTLALSKGERCLEYRNPASASRCANTRGCRAGGRCARLRSTRTLARSQRH